MITPKKAVFDQALQEVLVKIDTNTVTCEDFNKLIGRTMIGETTPESVRDRLRRRTIKNSTDSHIEPETGHQHLTLPKMADRVQPRIKPEHQQNHGRARIAHRHSTKTQALRPAFEFIIKNHGSTITEEVLSGVGDREILKRVACKLLTDPELDRDWLYKLVRKLDNG